MKSLARNSLFLFLSSTMVTALVAVLWQESIFPTAAHQTASVTEALFTEEFEGSDDIFVSFEEILAAINGRAVATTSLEQAEPVTEEEIEEEVEFIPPPTNLGEAIVHIKCVQKTDQFKKTISGTGFFVHSRGVIITNAHVAQFLLLKGIAGQGVMECAASTGVDGAETYGIELLYISPTWLLEHASLINDTNPKGSGENDFALLYVTTADNEPVTTKFAHLPPATNPLSKAMKGETVILVGYPKEGGVGSNVRTIATTTIRGVYTFNEGSFADVISLSDSPLGYNGASGGPVIDHLGRSIGMIATKSNGSTVLNAITMSHIDRSIKAEAGADLITILEGDLAARAKLFREIISPILQKVLVDSN